MPTVRFTRATPCYVPPGHLRNFAQDEIVNGDIAAFAMATLPADLWEDVEPAPEPAKAEPAPGTLGSGARQADARLTHSDLVAKAVASEVTAPVKAEPVPVLADVDYDPSEHTVAEVKDYLRDHPEAKAAVLAQERTGKGRTALLVL